MKADHGVAYGTLFRGNPAWSPYEDFDERSFLDEGRHMSEILWPEGEAGLLGRTEAPGSKIAKGHEGDRQHQSHEDSTRPRSSIEHEIINWRMRERMKTVGVALVLCLNIGTDPPDIVKTSPCARKECWLDPFSMPAPKAMETIGKQLQAQYLRWQHNARYRQSLDPTVEDVKKIGQSMRRNAKSDRVLFHYNGHGVPRPTPNGEIWVFNKNYTQYIPLSVYDLQAWVGTPSVYVLDCSAGGVLLPHFAVGEEHNRDSPDYSGGYSSGTPSTPSPPIPPGVSHSSHETIVLAACGAQELLPMNPEFPADLFTACLTTPITVALRWFVSKNSLSMEHLPPGFIEKIPGKLIDRKTPLGELNWIFTAITDTIAWNLLPRELFQKLFRQDLLVASLFRNFLLAERVMQSVNCHPCSIPRLPNTHQHSLWQAWDLAVETRLSQLARILNPPPGVEITFQPSPFFAEQLTAFEVWLEFGSEHKKPPEQLPIVLQVLLSQVHRLRALVLLRRFLDLGPWAVNLALSVGIFPYVLKLLESPAVELRQVLVFIWAKILALDQSCQVDLVKDGGHRYFVKNLTGGSTAVGGSTMPSGQKVMAAFILAVICDNYPLGKLACLQENLHSTCSILLSDPDPLLRRWLCFSLAKLCEGYEEAKVAAIQVNAPSRLLGLLSDPVPEVRAASLYALGRILGFDNEAQGSPEGLQESERVRVDLAIALELSWALIDGSPLVRREAVMALANLVFHPYHRMYFEKVARNQKLSPEKFGEKHRMRPKVHDKEHRTDKMDHSVSEHAASSGSSSSSSSSSTSFSLSLSGMSSRQAAGSAPAAPGAEHTDAHKWINSRESDSKTMLRPNKASSGLGAGYSASDLAQKKGASKSPLGPQPVSLTDSSALRKVVAGIALSSGPEGAQGMSQSEHVDRERSPLSPNNADATAKASSAAEALDWRRRADKGPKGLADARAEVADQRTGGGESFIGDYLSLWRHLKDVQSKDPFPPVAAAAGLIITTINKQVFSQHAIPRAQPYGTLHRDGSLPDFRPFQQSANARSGSVEHGAGGAAAVGVSPPPPVGSHGERSTTTVPPVIRPLRSLGAAPRLQVPVEVKIELPAELQSRLFEWSRERFNEPMMENLQEEEDPFSEQGAAKLSRRRRNERIRRAAEALSRGDRGVKELYLESAGSVGMDVAAARSRYGPFVAPHTFDGRRSSSLSLQSRTASLATGTALATAVTPPKLEQSVILDNDSQMTSLLLFHPFEPMLVMADERDGISIWNFEEGERIVKFSNQNTHGSRVTTLGWLNESQESRLLCGSDDGVVRIWRGVHDERHVRPYLLTAFAAIPDLMPDSRGSGLVARWDQQEGSLFVGGNSNFIRKWDLDKEQCVSSVPTGTAWCVTSMTRGHEFGTNEEGTNAHGALGGGGGDQNGGSGGGAAPLSSPAVLVSGCGDGSIRVFDWRMKNGGAQNSLVSILNEHQEWIVHTHVRRGSLELVSGSVSGDVKFWDLRRGGPSIKTINAHRSLMTAMAVHDYSNILASGSHNQFIKVFSMEGETLNMIRYHDGFLGQRIGPVSCLAFHPHLLYLAAGATDSIVSVYSKET